MSTARRSLTTLAGVVAAGVVLSGCGVADSVVQPGAAAVVDGTTISIGDVDEVARDLCGFFDSSEGSGQEALSAGDVRGQVLQFLAQRAAAERFLADYDADLYSEYASAVASNEQENAELPADQREALGVVNEASIYHQAALLGVGIELLDGADDDLTAASERGTAAFAEWVSDHDVTVNPMFAVAVEDGAIVVTEETTELSVPASSVAKLEPAALPADQVCGA